MGAKITDDILFEFEMKKCKHCNDEGFCFCEECGFKKSDNKCAVSEAVKQKEVTI